MRFGTTFKTNKLQKLKSFPLVLVHILILVLLVLTSRHERGSDKNILRSILSKDDGKPASEHKPEDRRADGRIDRCAVLRMSVGEECRQLASLCYRLYLLAGEEDEGEEVHDEA